MVKPEAQDDSLLRKTVERELIETETMVEHLRHPKPIGFLGLGGRVPTEEIRQLEARISQLQQLKEWMDRDPDILHLVDSLIHNRVRAAARRQSILSVGIAILSLIAGWLLSALSPVNFLNLIHH